MKNISVLIVEDDPMVVDIHRKYILSVAGFDVIGFVHGGKEAIEFLEKNNDVMLVVLDIFMPEMDGIETLKNIREKRKDVDVIVITAAKEGHTIKEVLRYGAFDYIIKPFTFERFKNSLNAYKKHYQKIFSDTEQVNQNEVDELFISKKQTKNNLSLPKGLQMTTLEKIVAFLKEKKTPLSAREVAREIGVSRVTARRYLEYLVVSGKAVIELNYQSVGRPINKYKFLK